jgi:hypothetical protein
MRQIAIMQPYIFPYIGYFQLIQTVDKFVFYNDVNFIKKGWIHRNRILLNGKEFLFTIPCADISQNRKICETELAMDAKERNKFLMTLVQSYKRAPFFEKIYSFIERIVNKEFQHIDELAMESVQQVCSLLDIKTELTESKNQYGNEELRKADRLIDICNKEKILSYINPVGGQEIYAKEYFLERGISISFIKSNPISYPQFDKEFIPGLSIIDVLMFNDNERISAYLRNFELL